MPEMTLTEAAKWAGVSRPTMFKAIKAGRLSSTKTETGEYRIDPAEVERAFGEHRNRKQEKQHQGGVALVGSETSALIASKDEKIALLETMLDEVRQQRADALKQRDESQRREDEIRRFLHDMPLRLAHQPSTDATIKPPQPEKKLTFWNKVRGFGHRFPGTDE